MQNIEFINTYFDKLKNIIDNIDRDKIDQAIELLLETWRNGNTVYVMGNGGSASTASHMVCDLAKVTISEGKNRLKVMGLTDNAALISAWTNDSGFGTIFAEQLRPFIKKGDVLIGVSVHGGSGEGEAGPWSQNLVQAMKLAQEREAKIIGFSGFSGGAMAKMSDVCMVVPIDTEPLGTPLVEAFHVALHHLIAVSLKLRIQEL